MNIIMNKLLFSIRWWFQGLTYLCPNSIRKFFTTELPDLLVIKNNDSEVTIQHIDSSDQSLIEERTFQLNVAFFKQQSIYNWNAEIQNERNTRIIYRLEPSDILHKSVTLPHTAKDTIREVLDFEMDRSTPFKRTDVYFDYFVHDELTEQNELQIELYIVKKNIIDVILNNVNLWQVKLDTITAKDNPHPIELNFIPIDKQLRPDKIEFTRTAILSSLCLVLMATALYFPIAQKENYITELQVSLKDYRQQALEVQKIKNEKIALVEKAQYLVNKHSSQMPPIIILNEVSKKIPDNTSLNRIIFKNNQLQLQGESDNATGLIPLLESLPFFSKVEFQSPTTVNRKTQKEKFQLRISVERNNEHG